MKKNQTQNINQNQFIQEKIEREISHLPSQEDSERWRSGGREKEKWERRKLEKTRGKMAKLQLDNSF
jgi:hypothetical protein